MKARSLILVIVLTIVVAACGGDDDDAADTPADDDSTEQTTVSEGDAAAEDVCTEDKVGGSATFAIAAPAQSWNIGFAPGGGISVGPELIPFYDSIARLDAATGEWVPQVAEAIAPNDDFSEWTVTLREDVTFGNGDPLDAAAFEAHLDRLLDPDGESIAKGNSQFIASYEVVDPMTVKFVLTQPWAQFPLQLSAAAPSNNSLGLVANVALIEEMGADAYGQNPNGGGVGPYEVERWAPPEEIVLRAKEDWWGGPVCIEELRFTTLGGAPAASDSLETRDVDIAYMQRDAATVAATKDFVENFASRLANAAYQVEMNQANPILADARVREAVTLAIDPEVINERAFSGELRAWSGLFVEGNPQIPGGTEGIAQNVDRAMELVEEAKADLGWDGSLNFWAADAPPANVEAAVTVKALLDAVGFNINLVPGPLSELNTKVYVDRDFDLWLGGQAADLSAFYSSIRRFDSRNPSNNYAVSNPDLDAVLDEMRSTPLPEFAGVAQELQDVWNEAFPSVPFGADEPHLFWLDRVKGLYFGSSVIPYFDQAYVE